MMRLPIAPVLLIALACAIALLAGPGAEASPDVTITVNSNADTEDPDSVLTLREAMLLATGKLSRNVTEEECYLVSTGFWLGWPVDACLFSADPGAASADTIVFSTSVFPPDNPETITLGWSYKLPVLDTGDDTVDGSSAGVIVEGTGNYPCFDITSDDNTIKGLQIHNFRYDGVSIHDGAQNNTIKGLQIYNCYPGVSISEGAQNNAIGGSSPADRNVISGSSGNGVVIGGNGTNGNSVQGNYIGTDASGTAAMPNMWGVNVGGDAQNNTIGGSSPGEGNVISGNEMRGVGISSDGNRVEGNYIGTDASGTAAVPNELGVGISGDGNTVEGNVISGNEWSGVWILTYGGGGGNTVKGNYIGTDASGMAPLPNGVQGLRISDDTQGNTIGGSHAGEGNTIAFNREDGILVGGFVSTIVLEAHEGVLASSPGTTGNTISGNSIHSNEGMGIENIDGGNAELAPPIVDSAVGSASGHTSPKCYPCTVEVFSDNEDEGRIYHGSTTTNDDAFGSWAYDDTVLGPNVTATITDASGNTSEFSEPVAVAEPEPSPTPSPTPSPSATPSPNPTPGGTTLDIALVAGWNHVCYTGPEQPIADALAPLGDDVAAVYRLRPDQGYDRWFPNLPGSNITTVSPYQPLFLLMLDSALWTQHPATPPTSVGLLYGWNSACYLGQTKPPSDATAAIASQLAILYKLDSSHGWGHYMPDRPGDSTIAQLERYAAVFMLVTAASGATWAFDQ